MLWVGLIDVKFMSRNMHYHMQPAFHKLPVFTHFTEIKLLHNGWAGRRAKNSRIYISHKRGKKVCLSLIETVDSTWEDCIDYPHNNRVSWAGDLGVGKAETIPSTTATQWRRSTKWSVREIVGNGDRQLKHTSTKWASHAGIYCLLA